MSRIDNPQADAVRRPPPAGEGRLGSGPTPAPGQDLKEAAARRGSFLQTLRAVAWSFFGVRRGAGYEEDVAKLNPVHVVIAGVIGAALFVLLLVLMVQWVIGSGVAGS